jgi:hypothetical protein
LNDTDPHIAENILGPLAQKLLGNAAFWDTNALEFKRGGVSEEKLQKIREAMFALGMTPNNFRRETDLPNRLL